MNHNREREILSDLESGYDEMSDKFSGTRKYFWGDFEFISSYVDNGDKVLDLGCGNGRLLEIFKNKNIEYFGLDVSRKLVNIAKGKYSGEKIKFDKISDSSSLSFSDSFFNVIFSIAVFHHFPRNYALKVAKELYRITKPGGVIVISAWNLWQKRFWKNIFGADVIWKKIFQVGEYQGLGLKDIFISFKNNNKQEIFNRYHYAYTQKELENILIEAGFEIEKSEVINKKNIIIIGRK
ncbi:MAG: class I SAM-dependent methyltransferase [Patescibacteria group bacterium]|jgi:ubiquinone/menaquinone biosynthesis C-methylase UbiE|nr:class I SAM-dependent methyltransferase [Patescibacteria group bacterium]